MSFGHLFLERRVISISQTEESIARLSAANDSARVGTQGAVLAMMRRGKGRPILCLHATGHGSGDFERFAKDHLDGFEVVAPDWPGQGLSPYDGVSPDAGHYADLAIGLIEELGLKKPLVLGNSIGGAAAILLAVRRPDLVSGLVLCNAGGLAPIDGLARNVIGLMVRFFDAGARQASWYGAAFRFYYRRLVLPRAPERAAQIIAAGSALAPLLKQAWAGFAADEADLRSLPQTINVPVLIAWAKHDRFIAWGRSQKGAKSFPTRMIKLFRGGHAPFLEDPTRFAAALRRFVGKHL